jgi:D-alanyl-lipoteichoic acid acyltransferase DltB (MBOAT superfamily)
MLAGLLGAIALAPLYWLLVPPRFRRDAAAAGSLVGLALYDLRLVVLLAGIVVLLFALMRVAATAKGVRGSLLSGGGLLLLVALFVWNKLAGQGAGALPSQSGLALLGVSYLVLKAAAALVETRRGAFADATFGEVLAWIVFLPTYPSGPMEDLDHFRRQTPVFSWIGMSHGLERILTGLVKALVGAHYIGEWAAPVFSSPETYDRPVLLLALYAYSLRFYLDFSGYSDIAVGLGALFGYEIEENFDNPFARRNLVQLWQRWHMTLTRWLRLYIFIPIARSLTRRGRGGDRLAAVAGQAGAMMVCGLWHGLEWNFAVWGLLQALGLIWVGLFARDIGRRLPRGLVSWWRESRTAYAASTALTFTAFSVSLIFVVADTRSAIDYLRLLAGC